MCGFSELLSTFVPSMKKLLLFVLPLLFTVACSNKGVVEQLIEIDSLVTHEQYDSANILLVKIDTSILEDGGTKAHYYLLRTHLACVLRKNDSINMLDSIVIPYYTETANKEKLAEAYYYKAYGLIKQKQVPAAITLYKYAEKMASNSYDLRLQYKIAEGLAYTNSVSGNYKLQRDYLRRAIRCAKALDNRDWEAHSLLNMAYAQSCLGCNDSTVYYSQKASELKNYIAIKDKQAFLTSIAYTNKYNQPEIAKKYYQEALQLGDNSAILEHLADIYYDEGNKEETYNLLKKALTIEDSNPKDNILLNLLEYDMEHGRTDSVCLYVNEIIAIKDSLINNLRNDTIKDLQLRFDHEVAMRKQETITNNWQKGLLASILFISLLIAYIIIKRYREKARMQEAQIQINDLMDQIRELEASEDDNTAAIQKLNDQIKNIMDKEGALLKQGKILYDRIKDGKKVHGWRKKDFELFINYYKAIDYKTVNRLEKTKRKEKLTPQKMFFLLLNEMGYDKKDIARILSISDTSVNTLYFRTKPIE